MQDAQIEQHSSDEKCQLSLAKLDSSRENNFEAVTALHRKPLFNPKITLPGLCDLNQNNQYKKDLNIMIVDETSALSTEIELPTDLPNSIADDMLAVEDSNHTTPSRCYTDYSQYRSYAKNKQHGLLGTTTPSVARLQKIEDFKERIYNTKIILSIDGGGCRGIIPLYLIHQIKKKFELADNELAMLFDMIAGTSIGAVIGAAIASGKFGEIYGVENASSATNDHLSDNHQTTNTVIASSKYQTSTMKKRISCCESIESLPNKFISNNFKFYNIAKQVFIKNTISCFGLVAPKYKDDGRYSVINQYFNYIGDGKKLLTNFMAIFVNPHTNQTEHYRHFINVAPQTIVDKLKLTDALMMSSAAPTYFNPHSAINSDNEEIYGIDGGVLANHPARAAFDETKRLFADEEPQFIIISLGTGESASHQSLKYANNKGLLFWAREISSISMEGSTNNTEKSLQKFAKDNVKTIEYVRLQPSVNPELMEMDKPQNIDKLERAAANYIADGRDGQKKFDDLLTLLKEKIENLIFTGQIPQRDGFTATKK